MTQEEFDRVALKIISQYETIRYVNRNDEDTNLDADDVSLEICNNDCWIIDFYYMCERETTPAVVINYNHFMKKLRHEFDEELTDEDIFYFMRHIIDNLFLLNGVRIRK